MVASERDHREPRLTRARSAPPQPATRRLNPSLQRFRPRPRSGRLRTVRLRIIVPLAATAALAVPAVARAAVVHVVAPGESLTSIAAADDVSVAALAAANRLSPDARLLAGATVRIPPRRAGRRSSSTRSTAAAARRAAPGRSR